MVYRKIKFAAFILLLLVAMDTATDGQATPQNKDSKCPRFQFNGTTSVTAPEVYSVVLTSGAENLQLVYEWSVFNGKILSGLGTNMIFVEREEDSPLTVTIKVLGLPAGCSHEDTFIPAFSAIFATVRSSSKCSSK